MAQANPLDIGMDQKGLTIFSGGCGSGGDRRTTVDFLSFMDDVLKRHPRVHFHYTATHASWMNMIECFFSTLTRQALTQSVQRSKKDLKEFLLRYLKKYSENPKPFT